MKNTTVNSLLLIDDDNVFRKRLAKAVRDRGIKVFEATNGEEACEVLKEFQPESALLDLKLEQESGLDILRQLHDIKSNLKVVVLTGYGTISTAVNSMKSGAFNYLTKPANADAILEAFGENIQKKSIMMDVPNLEQVEWDHINRVVADNNGNISKASKALGIHRRSLQRKLSKTPQSIK